MASETKKDTETTTTPEKIELETKNVDNNDEKKEVNETKDKKEKKKKEKKEKVVKETTKRSIDLCTQNFTIGLNVLDRDEKHVNQHINITFEDVLGEPDPTHGFEFVWRLSYLLFNATRFWFYRLIAAFIAIPLALLWALVFAFINLFTIWFLTPALRVLDIILHYVHRIWSGLIRTLLDPLFSSGALLFNNIRTRRETVAVDTVTTA
ncbi:caveolin-1-like isoform X2 [Oppia nitens]|uniref:caveolin-1-like isoform X2 n=1 Tax=Oppia nitens TaxID=1686743 RepID=UPI0023DCAECB|nr:caveolin-1-like isoform X2 [Oppia nitens]